MKLLTVLLIGLVVIVGAAVLPGMVRFNSPAVDQLFTSRVAANLEVYKTRHGGKHPPSIISQEVYNRPNYTSTSLNWHTPE